MYFDAGAAAYTRFMGCYSEPLASRFADACGVGHEGRAVDVGAGAGALTQVLVDRLGVACVDAVEPSAGFVTALRQRIPGVDVTSGPAEELPQPDSSFDFALAQLVVHFMTNPVKGLTQMRRVVRPGGVVAANVWDYAGGRSPLSTFWDVVAQLDPDAKNESGLAGARRGHLLTLFGQAGLHNAEETELRVDVAYDGFEQWWEPYTLGVGPAGSYVARLDGARRAELQEACRVRLPEGALTVTATAWTVLARI